jgi:DNA-binding NtrC family response regulator
MDKLRILFADNDEDTVMIHKDFLEQHDFMVITASSPSEARKILRAGHVDIAILDLRLSRPEDDQDRSGFEIAKEESPSIPKIIYTAADSLDIILEVFKTNSEGRTLAVAFVAKREGINSLLEAIKNHLNMTDTP